MSKITFRADEELVRRLEAFDASKSEVMRAALREYLAEHEPREEPASERTLDELVADRLDELVADRLETAGSGQDINLTISLDGADDARTVRAEPAERASDGPRAEPASDGAEAGPSDEGEPAEPASDERACGQCGEPLAAEHVYCPNCGEKASRRLFCECGDEIRSDWAFCPSCGRRTPAADVLD